MSLPTIPGDVSSLDSLRFDFLRAVALSDGGVEAAIHEAADRVAELQRQAYEGHELGTGRPGRGKPHTMATISAAYSKGKDRHEALVGPSTWYAGFNVNGTATRGPDDWVRPAGDAVEHTFALKVLHSGSRGLW